MLKSMLLCTVALRAAATVLAADPDGARRNGYQRINQDDANRCCRTDFEPGSHGRTPTAGLPEQALQERSQWGLHEITRAAAPPQGT